MPSITMKNIPDDLYNCLKSAAHLHHRSINGELIHCLENVLLPKRVDANEGIQMARVIRAKIKEGQISTEEIDAAKKLGRE